MPARPQLCRDRAPVHKGPSRASAHGRAAVHAGRVETDPGRLRRLAAAVREEAVRVRATARRLAAVRDVRWHSASGALFRDRVEERVHALRVTATRLDRAADLLDAHARHVEAVLAAVTAAAGAASDAAGRVARTVVGGGGASRG